MLEREPFARWVGDWWWFRIIALLILRKKRRTRGERVAPFPWSMVLLGWAVLVVIVLVIMVVALLFTILRARPYAL